MDDDINYIVLSDYLPHDSYSNREAQGGEPSAKCIMIPVDCPCIGCGECKN